LEKQFGTFSKRMQSAATTVAVAVAVAVAVRLFGCCCGMSNVILTCTQTIVSSASDNALRVQSLETMAKYFHSLPLLQYDNVRRLIDSDIFVYAFQREYASWMESIIACEAAPDPEAFIDDEENYTTLLAFDSIAGFLAIFARLLPKQLLSEHQVSLVTSLVDSLLKLYRLPHPMIQAALDCLGQLYLSNVLLNQYSSDTTPRDRNDYFTQLMNIVASGTICVCFLVVADTHTHTTASVVCCSVLTGRGVV
jgi:hypothetical protein